MRLDRPHHAVLDALEAADRPLTRTEILREAPDDLAASMVVDRLRFLERHGFIVSERGPQNQKMYRRADRGRTE